MLFIDFCVYFIRNTFSLKLFTFIKLNNYSSFFSFMFIINELFFAFIHSIWINIQLIFICVLVIALICFIRANKLWSWKYKLSELTITKFESMKICFPKKSFFPVHSLISRINICFFTYPSRNKTAPYVSLSVLSTFFILIRKASSFSTQI